MKLYPYSPCIASWYVQGQLCLIQISPLHDTKRYRRLHLLDGLEIRGLCSDVYLNPVLSSFVKVIRRVTVLQWYHLNACTVTASLCGHSGSIVCIDSSLRFSPSVRSLLMTRWRCRSWISSRFCSVYSDA